MQNSMIATTCGISKTNFFANITHFNTSHINISQTILKLNFTQHPLIFCEQYIKISNNCWLWGQASFAPVQSPFYFSTSSINLTVIQREHQRKFQIKDNQLAFEPSLFIFPFFYHQAFKSILSSKA
jgi:hypothetical protein